MINTLKSLVSSIMVLATLALMFALPMPGSRGQVSAMYYCPANLYSGVVTVDGVPTDNVTVTLDDLTNTPPTLSYKTLDGGWYWIETKDFQIYCSSAGNPIRITATYDGKSYSTTSPYKLSENTRIDLPIVTTVNAAADVSSTTTDPTYTSTSTASTTTNGTSTTTASSSSTTTGSTLTQLMISPASQSVFPGETRSFSVSGNTGTGSTSQSVTWSSSDSSVGTIDSNGLFTAVAPGNTIITASSGSASGSTNITVLQSIGSTSTSTATTTDPNAPPTVPIGLTATAVSPTQINLSWSPSTSGSSTTTITYRVFRDNTTPTSTPLTTTTQTSYSDTGLQPGSTHTYNLSAYDSAGNTSKQSLIVTATTLSSTSTSTGTTTEAWTNQQIMDLLNSLINILRDLNTQLGQINGKL
jgi:hypothetical protein